MGKTTLTPVSYEEAARLANKKIGAIRGAADRGTLVRLPSVGLVQQVVKEQVELFANKKQIRISMLSPQELEKWQAINKAVSNSTAQAPTLEKSYSSQDVAQILASWEVQRESLTSEEKKSSFPSSPSWQDSPSWQALHNDIKNLNTGETWALIILLLVLIGAYLAVRYLNKDVTFNKYVIDQNLESAKEYLPQPERVLSLVDEIAQNASSEEEASEQVIEAIQHLAMAA